MEQLIRNSTLGQPLARIAQEPSEYDGMHLGGRQVLRLCATQPLRAPGHQGMLLGTLLGSLHVWWLRILATPRPQLVT